MIPEKSRREVGVEEAKSYARKAIGEGLVLLTGKARFDNDLFMIRDVGTLMTLCFCCDCCCLTSLMGYTTPRLIDNAFHRVEGISIRVSNDCVGCGTCVSKCFINAIGIEDGRAVIGDMCRVCGRCASVCPEKAMKLNLDNLNVVDDVVRRIEAAVDF